jgi:hypothetical protein
MRSLPLALRRPPGPADGQPSTVSVPSIPGWSVHTNSYSPGSGATNSIVSSSPEATVVAVATLIGSPNVRLQFPA